MEEADRLTEYFIKSTSDVDSLKFQRLFFDAFPANFADFNSMFGWTEDKESNEVKYGPLYDGHNEIDLFFKIKIKPEEKVYKKIIGIGLGGHWDADAINYFQQGLRQKILANPTLSFKLLADFSDSDIENFFIFFFDGVHPQYKAIPNQLTKMKSHDPRTYELMENGLKLVLNKSEH